MAFSSSNFTKKFKRYKLLTLSLIILSLLCFFLFNRRVLDPRLGDLNLISQTAPILVSGSPLSHVKRGGLRPPNSLSSDLEEIADGNLTASSKLVEPEFQGDRNVETTAPVSSNLDLDDETPQKTPEQFVLSEPESADERTGEAESSNEENVVPISSNPNHDDKTPQKTSEPSVLSEPESADERTGEAESSNEENVVPISSNLNHDDKAPQKTSERSISSELGSEDDSGERTGDAESLNEENVVPISSNPNHDDETPPKTSGLSVSSDDDSGAMKGESELLNDKKIVRITSKSDFDDINSGKSEESGVKEESASSDGETEGFIDNAVAEKLRNCDIYKGKWVKDERYPVYKPGSCPYVDEGFNCQSNGRPDSAYTQLRWKPDECELPRFNATDFLVRLRGKRLMLVGDSMNRNQFESLLCLLREGLSDKSKMYETRGNKITKGRGYFIFKFVDYDCTVEFVRSHFLVKEGVRVNAQGNSNPTLSIDRIDKTATRWLRADILVFNTGHWWTHGKTSRGKNYYKEGDYIHPKFDAVEAYRRAIKTWATWIKRNIKRDKLVFYRGYSSAHFRGGDWDSGGSCNGETEPVVQGAIIDSYPEKMRIVEEIFKETQVRAVLLNVTRLTNYRKDGHPSVYGKNVTLLKKVSTRRQDCSHWCLPGVPDAWNELIYATLVARQT